MTWGTERNKRNELCMNIKDRKKWEEWEILGKINELCMSLNIKKNERQQWKEMSGEVAR